MTWDRGLVLLKSYNSAGCILPLSSPISPFIFHSVLHHLSFLLSFPLLLGILPSPSPSQPSPSHLPQTLQPLNSFHLFSPDSLFSLLRLRDSHSLFLLHFSVFFPLFSRSPFFLTVLTSQTKWGFVEERFPAHCTPCSGYVVNGPTSARTTSLITFRRNKTGLGIIIHIVTYVCPETEKPFSEHFYLESSFDEEDMVRQWRWNTFLGLFYDDGKWPIIYRQYHNQ